MNVAEILLQRGDPEASAVTDNQGAVLTYARLRQLVASASTWMAQAGVARGDRVVLIAENTTFFIVGYLATMHLGAVVVPLDPVITPEDLAYILDTTDATCAFVQKRRYGKLAEVLGRVKHRVVDALDPKSTLEVTVLDETLVGGPAAAMAASDLAALMFTSGSTGRPRAVMVSHENIAANTEAIATYLSLDASDRMMVVLPLHYCYGASLLHTHLFVGGSIVIDNKFMFVDKVLKRMIETECTGFAGVPSHFQILARTSSMKTMSFPKLRHVQQAGGKLADSLISEIRQMIGSAKLFIMYGQTEATARLSYLPPDALDTKLGSIGKGIPGITLTLVEGEIIAEGPSVTLGYWKDEAATATTFADRKLHTGDLARVDDDGFIFIVDRLKDFLKCGGVRSSSLAIESVVFEVPEVVEAAVIAIPDDLLGEAPCVFVVVREDSGDRDALIERLRTHCASRLAAELVPKLIRVEPSLPKRASGKLDKPALRARITT